MFAILQETLNYWKQLSHVMKYFRADEDPNARLPKNFISGFLEVRSPFSNYSTHLVPELNLTKIFHRAATKVFACVCHISFQFLHYSLCRSQIPHYPILSTPKVLVLEMVFSQTK